MCEPLYEYVYSILQEREKRDLQFVVVQGGADGADAIARECAIVNKEIGGDVELITDPHYLITCRL